MKALTQEVHDFLAETEKVYFPNTPWSHDMALGFMLTGLKLVLRVLVELKEEGATSESKWNPR